jgi:hypothetical protein
MKSTTHRANNPAAPRKRLQGYQRVVRDRSTVVRPTPVEDLDLTSKTMAVIGGTNGIGRALAQQAWRAVPRSPWSDGRYVTAPPHD